MYEKHFPCPETSFLQAWRGGGKYASGCSGGAVWVMGHWKKRSMLWLGWMRENKCNTVSEMLDANLVHDFVSFLGLVTVVFPSCSLKLPGRSK